jgi:glucan phosphorylase
VLDGWWLEGHIEGVTGWAIGGDGIRLHQQPMDSAEDATALYDALERTVIPLFYRSRDRFIDVMRYAIALNGSFFTAQRMLHEYTIKAYNITPATEDEVESSAHKSNAADRMRRGPMLASFGCSRVGAGD